MLVARVDIGAMVPATGGWLARGFGAHAAWLVEIAGPSGSRGGAARAAWFQDNPELEVRTFASLPERDGGQTALYHPWIKVL